MVARRGGVGYESAAGKKRLEEFKRRKEAKKKVDPPKPVKKAKDKITGKGAIRTKDGQLNVTKTQIDKLGMTLTQYVNYFKKHGKRPTAKVTTGPRSGDKSKQPVMAGKNVRPLGKKEVRRAVEKTVGQRGDKPLTSSTIKINMPAYLENRPLGRGEVRKAIDKTSRERAPKPGDTTKQPVMAGKATSQRALKSGDTTKQPVMAGKATSQRALRSGDTSKQPVTAGSVRDAREARHPQSQYRKMMRDRLKNRQKMSKGGTAQVSKSKGSNFKGIY